MKRVAVWVHGGISGGPHEEGMPVLNQLLEGLAAAVELRVYCLWTVPRGVQKPFAVVSPPQWLPTRVLRLGYLLGWFLVHHLRQRYHIVQAFWALPAGRIVLRLGKVLGIKSVVTFMGGESAHLPELGYGILAEAAKRTEVFYQYEQADGLVLLSDHAQRQLEAHGATRPRPPHRIWFGIAPGFGYAPGAFGEPLRLVCIGNLYPIKDQLTVLEGFARLVQATPAELLLLGSDFEGYMDRLRARAAELGVADRVTLAGGVPYAEVAQALREADVLVHASHHEGQGLIYWEAMASGTLVVATPVGTAAELAQAGAIGSFAVGDAEGLAAEIRQLVADPELRAQRLALGKRLVQDLTPEATVEGYLRLYEGLG